MRRPDDTAPDATKGERFLDGFLADLARGLKAALFYPRFHPALRATVARVHDGYTRMQRARPGGASSDVLELGIGRKGFTWAGQPVGGGANGAADLSHECVIRGLSRLYLRPEATPDDLEQVLHLLTVDPEEIEQAGGFPVCLAATGVRSIWANETDLQAILDKLAAEPAAGRPQEEWFPFDSSEEEADDGIRDRAGADAPEPLSPEATSTEERMLALLARLDREIDSVAYEEMIGELRWPAVELRKTAPFETLLPALVVLGQHGSDPGRRGAAPQQMAEALLRDLVDDAVLAWLVKRVGAREARGERGELGRILLLLGPRALVTLLDALSAVEDRTARRALSQVIALFGEHAVPELEMRLRDERWFVVRNMAGLLGEVRSKASVPILTEFLAHEDGRVRRATLQALAKIGGALARAQVVRCLTSGDAEVQLQAILAVGAWREVTGLPALEALARGSGPGHRDPEVRRYAIEALGLVGGPTAVRVLARILRPRGFWRRLLPQREPSLVRIAAAEALAGIGGRHARELLAAAARERNAVADRCRELAATLW